VLISIIHDPSSSDTYPLSLLDALPIYSFGSFSCISPAWWTGCTSPFRRGPPPPKSTGASNTRFGGPFPIPPAARPSCSRSPAIRSEEHTSELQSRENLVCRLLLEKKKK